VAKYDVAIIGSGPGGYVAAIRAGELGLKTMVVEKDPYLGGTCLHVGCIPTKVLLHHADVYDHFKNAAELGFEVSGLKINWANVLARKDKIVKKHAKGIEFLFKKNKVEWAQGWGRYEGPGRISVEKDGKKTEIEASNILMVSGSEARALPGIEPDHKTILTNRSILELPSIPKTLIVVGAGAVGVEFASIYNSFGTEVTILEALPRVVPVEDEEISAELDKSFRKKNIQIHTSSKVESVKKDAKGVTVVFTDKDGKKQTLQAEKLLLAVGKLRVGKIKSQDGSRVCTRRSSHGDGRKRFIRHRRHRRRPAATGARGHDGRNRGGHAHCRQTDPRDCEDPHTQRHLLRAADWFDWINRETGAGCGTRSKDRQISLRW
jgi:dihydrolipoamide dehydrogenase